VTGVARFQAPYRAAVIGRTGRGDYGHGLDVALLDQPKLRVVAVADDDPAGLAAAAKRLKVDKAYADYREMLDREKPDFVAVAPRWVDQHKNMILACTERGASIFSEKPLAPDLSEADAIVRACEAQHVKLAIAFQTRYSPRFERVKDMVASGAIGEVLELRGRGKEDHRGGGEDLMVLGPHVVDLFRGLLGDAAWCFARVSDAGKPATKQSVRPGAEGLGPLAGDRVDAVYGFNGTPAVAHFATDRPKDGAGANRRFALWVCGSKGVIRMETGWLPPAYLLDSPDWDGVGKSERWVEITSAGPGKPEPMSGNVADANRVIVADLVRAVETDTQPRASVYDARASLEMLLACHASHVRGGPVTLPLDQRDRHPLATW
jgi:predicted dehydrogenase